MILFLRFLLSFGLDWEDIIKHSRSELRARRRARKKILPLAHDSRFPLASLSPLFDKIRKKITPVLQASLKVRVYTKKMQVTSGIFHGTPRESFG